MYIVVKLHHRLAEDVALPLLRTLGVEAHLGYAGKGETAFENLLPYLEITEVGPVFRRKRRSSTSL